jgi:methionine-rich copper-binding protein CopC
VASKVSTFIVGTSPVILSSSPTNGAINIARTKTITITFNEAIKAGSMWIELKNSSGTTITTAKSINGKILTIDPTITLARGTRYTVLIHTGAVTDLAGNPIASKVITFTTGNT